MKIKPDFFQYLLSNGAEIDDVDYGGSTPLHYAAEHCHLEAVELILNGGCDVNHCSKSGRTAIWKAAVAGKSVIMIDVVVITAMALYCRPV